MLKTVGRPRSQAANESILLAAQQLFFQHPYSDVTMEMLAQQAGVSKATLYRRWSNKSELAIALMIDLVLSKTPDFVVQGSYRERLIVKLQGLRDLLASPYADVIASIIALAQHDQQLQKTFIEQFLRPVQAIGDEDLARALKDGELEFPLDQDLLFDQMFGFFYYRLLVAGREISDGDIEGIVTIFLGADRV